MSGRGPAHDLARLLDALEPDMLAASEEELRQALAGRSPAAAAAEIRRIVQAALAERDNPEAGLPVGSRPPARPWGKGADR